MHDTAVVIRRPEQRSSVSNFKVVFLSSLNIAKVNRNKAVTIRAVLLVSNSLAERKVGGIA